MRQTFLSKTFAKSLNIQKQYEKNVSEKSNDAYSLSIRVQTTINHISIFTLLCFLRDQKKCFLSERELKKTLGSLRNDDATPRKTSIKKSCYVLSTNLAILLSHLFCLSLSNLSKLNSEHSDKFEIKI